MRIYCRSFNKDLGGIIQLESVTKDTKLVVSLPAIPYSPQDKDIHPGRRHLR